MKLIVLEVDATGDEVPPIVEYLKERLVTSQRLDEQDQKITDLRAEVDQLKQDLAGVTDDGGQIAALTERLTLAEEHLRTAETDLRQVDILPVTP